jgi:hypothetical protein
MPDVSSNAPADVRLWVALDARKLSIVAATLPAAGGTPEVIEIENSERVDPPAGRPARRPQGLGVCYEAGAGCAGSSSDCWIGSPLRVT